MFSSTTARRQGLLRSHVGADDVLSFSRCSIPGLLQRYRKLSETSFILKNVLFVRHCYRAQLSLPYLPDPPCLLFCDQLSCFLVLSFMRRRRADPVRDTCTAQCLLTPCGIAAELKGVSLTLLLLLFVLYYYPLSFV